LIAKGGRKDCIAVEGRLLSGVSSLHLEQPVRGELERPLSDYASAAGGL